MVACRSRGIDDDARYDLIERLTGKRSSRALTFDELGRVLDEVNGKGGPGSGGNEGAQRRKSSAFPDEDSPATRSTSSNKRSPYAALHGKISALWWSCYWLGALDMPAGQTAAVDSFVKRQSGVDALRFVTHREAPAIIEALKAIAARHGVVWPRKNDPDSEAVADRQAVAEAIAGQILAVLPKVVPAKGRPVQEATDPVAGVAFRQDLPRDRSRWSARTWDLFISQLGERLHNLKTRTAD
jgi:hypothetical protein